MLRFVIAAALIAACSAPPPPPPPKKVIVRAPPPVPPPPPAKTPFHVIGWSEHVSDKDGNPTSLCAIEGSVFICGTKHVVRLAGDDLVLDPSVEAGLARDPDGTLQGRVDEMLGRYPDDAWLVVRSAPDRSGPASLYRRDIEWKLVKRWKLESSSARVDFMHWKKRSVAALATLDGERHVVEVLSKTGAQKMPNLAPGGGCREWLGGAQLAIAKSGALILTGTRCDGGTPAWLTVATGEKHDGAPEYAAHAPPAGPYRIVSGAIVDKTGEEVTMPDPPVPNASTLVPFQLLTRDGETIIAARFQKEKMHGVAILRTKPANVRAKL